MRAPSSAPPTASEKSGGCPALRHTSLAMRVTATAVSGVSSDGFHTTVSQHLKKVGTGYELQLQLPFVSKDEVDITHRPGELFVSVGPYKREISLPRVLNGTRVTKGRLDEGMLRVTFAGAEK